MRRSIWLVPFSLLFITTAGISDPPTEEWVVRFNGPGNADDTAYDMALDPYGNVYIAGSSYDDVSSYDYVTIKYDSDGTELWVRYYNGPAGSWDEAYAIALDDSCNVYVTGWSYGTTTSCDYATIKYDSEGNQLWVARYDGPDSDIDAGIDIEVDKGYSVYVTGYSNSNSTSYDYATVKYDIDGNEEWVVRYNGAADSYDEVTGLVLDYYENVIVTGSSINFSPNSDFATIAYDQDGSYLWKGVYNGPDNLIDFACDIAADAFGNVVVTGVSDDSLNSRDYFTVMYNVNGDTVWTAMYDGPDNDIDYAEALAIDGSGNTYVTGESVGIDTYYDFATVKYDSDGNQQWVARYNGPLNDDDEANAIMVDNMENIYVAGYQTNTNDYFDFVTIMYDTAGDEQWVMTYDGPSGENDEACSVVADDDGNVYVTGYSYDLSTDYDIVTIKYSQSLNIGLSENMNFPEFLSVSPNPSSGLLTISYSLSCSGMIDLVLYDISGRIVDKYFYAEQDSGICQISVEGLAPGLYFCKLGTNSVSLTESFIVIN